MVRTKGKHFYKKETSKGVLVVRGAFCIMLIVAVMSCFIAWAEETSTEIADAVEIETVDTAVHDSDAEQTKTETIMDTEVAKPSDTVAMSYSEQEYSLFCQLLYAEAGGEENDCMIATAWAIRNRVEKKGDFLEAIFTPNAFHPADEENRDIRLGSGLIITDDIVTDDVRRVAYGVLQGTIPSPIEDWEYFLGFTACGYRDCDQFAQIHRLTDYKVIGNSVFFHESNWMNTL